jgi:hypothetical protein
VPARVYAIALLRLVPVAVLDWIADMLGIKVSMENFIGRKKI